MKINTEEDDAVILFRLLHGHSTSLMRKSDRRDATLMRAWCEGYPIDLGFVDPDTGECVFWYIRAEHLT